MNIAEVVNAIHPYRRLLVGFSGGLDSTVLLHLLKIWRELESDVRLRAVHINHGLSPKADSWMEHCVVLCRKWNIPLVVSRVTILKKGSSIEAQARRARYTAFKKILLPDEAIVTAQHLDDQCETFLLALKRGSGPSGLSAMSMRTKFVTTQLLRPLLNETRKSLKIWAQKNSLYWIEDESNQNDSCDRNFLRLHIMPLLSKRWPHISSAIARSSALCAEQENVLDELLIDELATLVSTEGALKIAPLTIMTSSRRSALLRRWLSSCGSLMPSRSLLNKIWKEVALARRDAVPSIHLNGYDIRRFKGSLWRIKQQTLCSDTVLAWNNLREPLVLPNGLGKVILKDGGNIRPPLRGETVSVRFKANGIIHIIGRRGGRKLKKVWQELNIPPWERTKIPLLFYDEILIAAAGYFITLEGNKIARSDIDGMYFEKCITKA